ncbi:hypothetical protein D3C81_2035810 [compost metagenome]
MIHIGVLKPGLNLLEGGEGSGLHQIPVGLYGLMKLMEQNLRFSPGNGCTSGQSGQPVLMNLPEQPAELLSLLVTVLA